MIKNMLIEIYIINKTYAKVKSPKQNIGLKVEFKN